MKLLGRCVSLMLASLFLCTTPVVNAALSEDHREAVDVMTGLYLLEGFEDETINPEDVLSRGEFVHQMNTFDRGVGGDLPFQGESPFLDVNVDSSYYKDIAFATYMGTVSKDERFYPERKILVSEAVAMVVRRLGYGVNAELAGGYPVGFLVTANKLDLLDNVEGELLTRENAIQLLYNMSQTYTQQISSYGTQGVSDSYSYEKSKVFLEETLDFIRGTGKLTAYGYESTGMNDADKTKVIIDDEIYDVGFTQPMNMLGEDVLYYYTEDFEGISGKTLLYAVPYQMDDKKLVIDIDDILKISGPDIEYTQNDRNKTITIRPDADILYNGRPVTESIEETLKNTKAGSLTFIDADGNGIYETLRILSGSNLVVKHYNPYDECITFKNGSPIYADEQVQMRLQLVSGKIVQNGESLKENDVLTVYKSIDDIFISGIVSQKQVTGIIEAIEEDSVTINDTQYDLSYDCSEDGIKIGLSATFYLNAAGEIVYVDTDNAENMYHKAVAIKLGTEQGVDATLKIRLLCEDGIVKEFSISDKMILDGVNVKNINNAYANYLKSGITDEIYSGLWGDGLKLHRDLIRYKLDAEGKIKEIDTARYNKEKEDPLDTLICIGNGFTGTADSDGNEIKKEIIADKAAGIASQQQKYIRALLKLSGTTDVYIKNTTTAFYAAANLSNWNEKDYRVQPATTLTNGKTYWMMSYKEAVDDVCATTVVNYRDRVVGEFSADTVPVIISDIRSALDEDGEPIQKIEYVSSNGKKVEVVSAFCRNEDVIRKAQPMVSKLSSDEAANEYYEVKRGDLVRMQYSDIGEVEKIELIYRAKENDMVCPNPLGQSSSAYGTTGKSDYFRLIQAYVASTKEDFVTFVFQKPYESGGEIIVGDNDEIHRIQSNIPILVCDLNARQDCVRVGSFADLKAYSEFGDKMSRAFLYTRYAEPKVLYIYVEE